MVEHVTYADIQAKMPGMASMGAIRFAMKAVVAVNAVAVAKRCC